MHKLTWEGVLGKKAISPLEEITFNRKQSNIFLVTVDFLWFEELHPAVTIFFQGRQTFTGCMYAWTQTKENILSSLNGKMKDFLSPAFK